MQNSVMSVDVDKVKAVYNHNLASKKFFDEYLFNRERGRQDTNIKRAQRVMKINGIDISTKDLAEIFRGLESLGLGKVVLGRHGNPTRFLWTANLTSIKDVLAGKSSTLFKQSPTAKKLHLPKLAPVRVSNSSSEEQESEEPTHMIVVRKGAIEVRVPANLTDKETKCLAALLSYAS